MPWTVLSFSQHFLKRQRGLNHIVFWSNFFKRQYELTILSFAEYFVKRLYGLNYFVFLSKLLKKTIWVGPYSLLVKIFLKDCMIWTILYFFSKVLKETIWVERYCLLVKIFLGDYMDWTVWSFGQSFPKKLYQLNCIFFWSQFS